MADNTKIEWTEATWNPIRARSIDADGTERKGKMLLQPLKWKRPRQIFVCTMTDLFADFVTDEMRDRIFAVMALCPQHTFQVLTKRSARMREYCISRFGGWGETQLCDAIEALGGFEKDGGGEWGEPLPNVWLGVSVENQAAADERIPDLLSTPAAIRWISAEPLLGPVDLREFCGGYYFQNPLTGHRYHDAPEGVASATDMAGNKLDWVVAGGESGKDARPMHPDWARSLRDQCAAADTPFFFKQWGEWAADTEMLKLPWHKHSEGTRWIDKDTGSPRLFRQRQSDSCMTRLTKKAAGRLLDGVEHNGMPTS